MICALVPATTCWESRALIIKSKHPSWKSSVESTFWVSSPRGEEKAKAIRCPIQKKKKRRRERNEKNIKVCHYLLSVWCHEWSANVLLKFNTGQCCPVWAETRWESKVKSVEPMRYQGAAVREALIEVRDHTKDPAIKADCLVFVWGGGVVPLQHLHGCLVWHIGMTCYLQDSMSANSCSLLI